MCKFDSDDAKPVRAIFGGAAQTHMQPVSIPHSVGGCGRSCYYLWLRLLMFCLQIVQRMRVLIGLVKALIMYMLRAMCNHACTYLEVRMKLVHVGKLDIRV